MSIYNAASSLLSAEYTDGRFRKPKRAYRMSASHRVVLDPASAVCLFRRLPVSPSTPYVPNFNEFPTGVRISFHESSGSISAVPPMVPLQFSRTEASLRPTGRSTLPKYTNGRGTEAPVHTFILSPLHLYSTMNLSKRVAAGEHWDRLPEEVVSLIAVKLVETSPSPLEDLRSFRLCNKSTNRASSSRTVANRINLDNHYEMMIWGNGATRTAYLQIVDWLIGANNGQALFINGWATCAWTDPMERHFLLLQQRKETSWRLTC
jgi:hypothetical protein